VHTAGLLPVAEADALGALPPCAAPFSYDGSRAATAAAAVDVRAWAARLWRGSVAVIPTWPWEPSQAAAEGAWGSADGVEAGGRIAGSCSGGRLRCWWCAGGCRLPMGEAGWADGAHVLPSYFVVA